MQILFVCHRLPYPPTRGGKIRPFHMIRHLGEKHSVTVASLAHTQQEFEEGARLTEYCEEVIAEVLPSTTRWKGAVAALPTKTPSSVAYFWSPELSRRIRRAASARKFDMIWLHCAFVAQYIDGIASKFRVLDYGDLDSGKWAEYSTTRPFPLSLGYGLEARKMWRYEVELAQHFDHCTFTAQGELDEFRSRKINVPASLIPNGVDSSYFQPPLQRPEPGSTIVFLGRMDYFPNIQGIVEFTREVFPLVRQHAPTAALRIIGSNPVREVRKLAAISGVTVTGSVPDVRPYFADAAVAIAPLNIARGTQNKILECMSMGVPVICSPKAALGVQATPGEHLMVANNHSDFARKVLEILENPALGRQIATAAREQLQVGHSWPRSMQLVDALLEHGGLQ